MGDVQRRLATVTEVEGLFELHRLAFRAHVEQLWGPWDEDWQLENFRRECAESSCEVVVCDETVVGYVQHVRETKRLRIWNIAFWPQFRGRGLGSWIVREFQQSAQSQGAEIVLRVFPGNLAALRFYERLGFRETSRTSTAIELTWPSPLSCSVK